MATLTPEQLASLAFRSLGNNIKLSDKASIYGAERIEMGDNCRIDDFCILSAGPGGIRIGSHVHIACYSSLIGAGVIELGDFVNISGRVSIYSSSDDYSGEWMTNPTIDEKFTNVCSALVKLGRHTIVGSGAVILPGVETGEGCAIGALSLVTRNCEEFAIYAGVPARYLKTRSRKLLEVELEFQEG